MVGETLRWQERTDDFTEVPRRMAESVGHRPRAEIPNRWDDHLWGVQRSRHVQKQQRPIAKKSSDNLWIPFAALM